MMRPALRVERPRPPPHAGTPLEPVLVEVVLYVCRRQLGQPIPLALPLSRASGTRIPGTRLVTVGEQVPLYAKVPGHLDERSLAALGELDDAHPSARRL